MRVCVYIASALASVAALAMAESQPFHLEAMFPLTEGDFVVGQAAMLGVEAAFSHASDWIQVKGNISFFDDRSDPRRGVIGAYDAVAKHNAIAVVGALNSAVSRSSNLMTSELGVVQSSCCSSSPELSQKVLYPTFVRTITADIFEVAMLAALMNHYKWSVVATISTSDPFGAGALAAFQNATAALNITIAANTVLDPSDLDGTDNSTIDTAFLKIREAQGRIIAVFATERDAKPLFERAHTLGMLGNAKYMFLGGNGLGDALLEGWDFAQHHPEALVGITTVSGGACQIDTPAYSKLAKYANQTKTELDMFTCLGWDSTALLLQALNNTIDRMAELNEKYNLTLGVDCLRAVEYEENREMCQLPDTEAKRIWDDAQCDGSCSMCGVCSFMALEDSKYRNSPQVALLQALYKQRYMGATGMVSLDKNGDRSALGTPFVIRNIQLAGPTKNVVPTFVRVGNIIQSGDSLASVQVKLTRSMLFGAGTTTIPPASEPIVPYDQPVALLAVAGAFAALGIILTMALGAAFFYYREQLVLKTSSPPFMYLLLVGAALMYASIFPLLAVPSAATCTANIWFSFIGFFLAFSAVFMKTYRIHVVFNNKARGRKRSIDDRRLLFLVCCVMTGVITYIGLWTGLSMPSVVYTIDTNQHIIMPQCDRDWWLYAGLITELVFVLWGVVLCIRVHRVPAFFNESRWIALTVYNWLFVFGTAETLRITLSQMTPATALAIQVAAVLLAVTAMLLLFFVPKLHLIYIGDGNRREFTSNNRVLSAGQGGKYAPDMRYSEGGSPSLDDLRRETDRLTAENAKLQIAIRTVGNFHILPSTEKTNTTVVPKTTPDVKETEVPLELETETIKV